MEKELQLGLNLTVENTRADGKMINIMGKESICLQMKIHGMEHISMVEQMAMALMFWMEKLLKIIALMISCMDMLQKKQKFNLKPIIIKVYLEWGKNLDMGF